MNYTPIKVNKDFSNKIENLTDLYYVFYRAWAHHIRYWHRDIQYGVRNLWRWLPTIWVDRNWDHRYLSDMMIKKLKYMRQEIRINSMEDEGSAGLDRCIMLYEEAVNRHDCNCDKLLMPGGCPNYLACQTESIEIMKEAMALYAEHYLSWWD